jgi:hypothetical protein
MEPKNKKVIDFQLTPKQLEVWKLFKRFTLWRAGRRGAKTRFAVYKQGRYALQNPNTVNWYVANESSILTDEIIPLVLRIFGELIVEDKTKGHNKYIVFHNGSKWFFKSANSNNSLRGRGIHSLVCEEAVFWQNGYSTFHETLRAGLADYMGWCLIISSPPSKKCPRGAEWFRRLEMQYKELIKDGSPDHAVFHSTIYDNPHINAKEIEDLKRTTDLETWQTEYMAEYNDKIGVVYFEFEPLKEKRCVEEKLLLRIRGMDFGIADNTACAWIGLLNESKVYIYEEYVANNLDVPSHAYAIKARTLAPVQWSVLDSACWARDATLTNVAKRFAQEGIACSQGTKDLDGSVSDMKRMFAAGNIIIDPKCTNLLQAIDQWQHGQHEPDILAATRYGIDALIRSGKLLPPMRIDRATNFKSWTEGRNAEIKANQELVKRLNNPNSGLKFSIM